MERREFFEQLEPRIFLSSSKLVFFDADGDEIRASGVIIKDLEGRTVQEGDRVEGIGSVEVIKSKGKIDNKGGGNEETDLSLAIITGENSNLYFKGNVQGGNFDLTNWKTLRFYQDVENAEIDSDYMKSLNIGGNTENSRVKITGLLKKAKLKDVDESIMEAEEIGSFRARNVHNTTIAANVDSVDGIYGDGNDKGLEGIVKTIGSVRVERYSGSESNGILAIGSFKAKINGKSFVASYVPREYGEAIVGTLALPPPTPPIPLEDIDYNFAVIADSHGKPREDIVWSIANTEPRFTAIAGDVLNKSSDEEYAGFFERMAPISEKGEIYAAVGNHDIMGDKNLGRWRGVWALPGNERFYSVETEDISHIFLNSTEDYRQGSEQYLWLESALSNSDSQFTFVYVHHPPFSGGGSESGVRKFLVPLFEQYNVDVVFSGHRHGYEHNMVNGIHYIVTGGAGGRLKSTSRKDFTIHKEKTYNFINVVVDNDTEKVGIQAIRDDGTEIESFVLS